MGKNFVKETKSELKKVIWPSRQDVINGTGVVIAMVAIVGVIILGFDFVSGWAVRQIMQINTSSQVSEYNNEHVEDESGNIVEENTNTENANTENTDVIPDSNTEVGNGADVADNGSAE